MTIPVEHDTDLVQYMPLLFQGKELYFMSGTTATLSTIDHRKCFCCISEQQCSTIFLVSVDFKRCSGSESLRHLSSTLSEQSNSEDVSLSMPIVHAGRSCWDVSVVTSD